jgi:hypothetical protein
VVTKVLTKKERTSVLHNIWTYCVKPGVLLLSHRGERRGSRPKTCVHNTNLRTCLFATSDIWPTTMAFSTDPSKLDEVNFGFLDGFYENETKFTYVRVSADEVETAYWVKMKGDASDKNGKLGKLRRVSIGEADTALDTAKTSFKAYKHEGKTGAQPSWFKVKVKEDLPPHYVLQPKRAKKTAFRAHQMVAPPMQHGQPMAATSQFSQHRLVPMPTQMHGDLPSDDSRVDQQAMYEPRQRQVPPSGDSRAAVDTRPQFGGTYQQAMYESRKQPVQPVQTVQTMPMQTVQTMQMQMPPSMPPSVYSRVARQQQTAAARQFPRKKKYPKQVSPPSVDDHQMVTDTWEGAYPDPRIKG